MPSGWTAPHFALSGDDIAVASVTRGWTFGKIARLVTVEPIGRASWLEAKQARGIAAEDCGLDGSGRCDEWDKVMCLLHLFGNLGPPQIPDMPLRCAGTDTTLRGQGKRATTK